MKKLRTIFGLSFLLICGCSIKDKCITADCLPENRENEITEEEKIATTSEEAIDTFLHLFNDCNYHNNSKTFIAYAILGTGLNEKGRTEYYLVVNGQGYYLDERGNISDECGFGGIPTRITIDETKELPSFQDYKTAEDGTEFDSSTKEMFSEKAYKAIKSGKYTFNNERPFLEQAEEYFNTTIIPKPKNNFECTFCDKLRYYEYTPEDYNKETNDSYFNYISENNGKNTIYFGSDGKFEAKGSRDEGKGTWVFGKDENTVIVSNENLNHVYDRYIITNVDENNLNTILEIIQK